MTQETTKKVVKKAAKKAVKKSVKKSVKKAVKKPVKKAVKKAVKTAEPKRKDPSKSKAAQVKPSEPTKPIESPVDGIQVYNGVEYKKPGTLIRDLLLERNKTDEEIFAIVDPLFPGKARKGYCNNWRYQLNELSGMEETKKNPIERLFRMDDGNLKKRSELPKKTKSKKYTKENDPLLKLAGIDVHKKEDQNVNDENKGTSDKPATIQKKVLKKVLKKRIVK